MLRRCPTVSNDEEWAELDMALLESGQRGSFFAAFVQTLKERVVDRSDVHKTSNATLRAMVAESYLAERVTMARYKKGKLVRRTLVLQIQLTAGVGSCLNNYSWQFI